MLFSQSPAWDNACLQNTMSPLWGKKITMSLSFFFNWTLICGAPAMVRTVLSAQDTKMNKTGCQPDWELTD